MLAEGKAGERPCNGCGAAAAKPSRRLWLFKVGLAFNAIAATLFAIPVLGYVLSGLFGKNPYRTWIPLGGVNDFPEDNTRLATFRNPFINGWDGVTGEIPCWVRRL